MRYNDENIWLTQKMMATLYDVGTNTITYHIKKIFDDSELQEDSAIRKFRIAAPDGKSYNTNNYSLEMIIAVGYILPLATKPRMSLRSYILILYDSFLFSVYYIDCGPHHIIHVKHLASSEESYREDVENGRIKAVSFFSEYYEELCFSYYPKNEFESAVLERNPYMAPFNRDTSPIPPKFVLPDGFHNIKKLDVSFLDSDEFDLSDLVDTELRIFKYYDPEEYNEYYRPCKKNKCRKSDK